MMRSAHRQASAPVRRFSLTLLACALATAACALAPTLPNEKGTAVLVELGFLGARTGWTHPAPLHACAIY